MKKLAIFLCSGLIAATACGTVDDEGGRRPETPEEPGREPGEYVLKDAPFPVGAAVTTQYLKQSPAYVATLKTDFNSLTAENEMKPDHISRSRGNYNFDDADYIIDFAQQNDMRVHGHTLLWYRTVPGWVRNFTGSRDEWIGMMEEYVTDVVTHFKGRVTSWDVVNEAFEDDGSWRSCVWYDNIGEDYIELAFRAAHSADPDAILFYNDYGMEYSTAKSDAICNFVRKLKADGVPVHGIGLQMHINIYTPKAKMLESIKAASDCEVLVHISELDVATNPEATHRVFTEELAQAQAETYKNMFEAFMTIPAARRFGITTWGVHDPQSWRAPDPDWALIFDEDFRPKAAYDAIIETFAE